MSLLLSDAEMLTQADHLRAAWLAGFQAARHFPAHTEPLLSVAWADGIPKTTPNWKIGQNRPGWIS